MRTVTVHGFTPTPLILKFAADTALDVVEYLGRMVPELASDLFTGPKRINVVGYQELGDMFIPLRSDDIHVVPSISGSKSGGLGQILLGAVLVAVSLVATPFIGAWAAGMLLKVGALLILGGLAQLLNPVPKIDGEGDSKSRYLGPPKNTTASGTRIPILVGYHRVGGHYLSYDINARSIRPVGN